ncbi:MAG TPA: tripartite tricarboxylate transporter permease [Salinarimonas sp.]|nr:tripartite tricarboxylate transporter permease [Salinarimonas sp.]
MDILANVALGFGIALTPDNLLFCLIGVALGTAIGVLPGLGPTATIALLLPITYRMDAVSSLIMLSGIYYGAMYGGSITSILVKVPGEGASVITCIDGYAMARKGRAGAALGLSAFGSFIAGVVGTVGVFLLGPALARVALAFGPAEYAALVVVGLVLVTYVAQSSMTGALLMVALGLLLATVGVDPIYGSERYTLGQLDLFDGIQMPILAMGLFGVAELLAVAAQRGGPPPLIASPRSTREMLPSREEWSQSTGAIARGTGLGFFLGLLPGGGALIASFASYVIEKRLSKHPEEFGRGAPAGVAGPESANNAAAQAAFIPLLSLGIPANVVMGVMMGGLLIQGIQPGPRLLETRPDLYWAVVCSMLIGNVMLIILNVPLISIFVRLLRIPFGVLSPLIIVFCVVGAYSLRNSAFDVGLMLVFGVVGWLMRAARLDPAPLILAFVLGDILERSVRQALLVGLGSPMIFVTRPISAALLTLAALLLLWPAARWCLARRSGKRRTGLPDLAE